MTLLLLLACHAPKDAPADSTGRDSATDSRPTDSLPTDSVATDSVPTDTTTTGGTGTTPTDTGPEDADGDGWPAWDDCDDADDAVHPGAEDVPEDGIDQDCNGIDKCQVRARFEGGGLTVMGGDGTDPTAEAEAFCATYDAMVGGLTVRDTDLVDLSVLSCICEIGMGIHVFDNPNLVSLTGLDKLDRVAEELEVYDNPSLTTLNGLDHLVSVGAAGFYDLPALASLEALGNLRNAPGLVVDGVGVSDLRGLERWDGNGGLTVRSDPDLVSLAGVERVASLEALLLTGIPGVPDYSELASLRQVGELIANLDAVAGDYRTLDGLARVDEWSVEPGDATDLYWPPLLTEVGRMQVVGVPTLARIADPAPFTSIEGDLWIEAASVLTDLSGFAPVTRVEGDLNLTNNDALTTLADLYGIEWVGGDLIIEYNAGLTDDIAYDLVLAIGEENIGGDIYIYRNGTR